MSKFKVGERIVDLDFESEMSGLKFRGTIKETTYTGYQILFDIDSANVLRERGFTDSSIILESVYNSKLYKLLNEET